MELWTSTHAKTLIPAVIIMILVGALLRLLIGKKDLKIRMIPYQIVACILFVIEIGKQVYSFVRGYDLYHLPFHFCSLFIFMLPISAFYRGKHRETVFSITAAICASMALLLLIYPCLIYSAGNIDHFFVGYLDFHTVAFHNLVILAFVLIIALDLHQPQPKGEITACTWFTTAFSVIAATMAQVLKTNYANYYSCNVPPLEQIRLNLQGVLGYWPTQILYIVILSVLQIGFVIMAYWFYRLCRRLVAGKTTVNA